MRRRVESHCAHEEASSPDARVQGCRGRMPGRPRCRSMGRLNVASLASRRPFVISWRAAIGLAPPAPLEPPLDLARRQRRDRAPCRSPSKFALMESMKPGTYSPSVSTAPISKSRIRHDSGCDKGMRNDRNTLYLAPVERDQQPVQGPENIKKIWKSVEIAASNVLFELFMLVPRHETPNGLPQVLRRVVDRF